MADLAIVTGAAMFIVLLLRIALRPRARQFYLGLIGAIWVWGLLNAAYLIGWLALDTFGEANMPASYSSFDQPRIGPGF